MRIYSKETGIKKVKSGLSLKQIRFKYPDAIEVFIPDIETLQDWDNEGGCEALDGCWVEPDGICEHGYNSWLRELGMI